MHWSVKGALRTFGITCIVIGLLAIAGSVHWYDTRDFVLVERPVSLAPGHIKTGDFATNLKGAYDISVELAPYGYGCAEYYALKTRWVVIRDGRVVAHREHTDEYWEDPNAPIGGTRLYDFDAEPGTYSADIEVLSDARCLDVRNPRLRVSLSDFDRAAYNSLYAELQFFSFPCIGLGVAFLFAHRFSRGRPKSEFLLLPSLPEKMPSWGITGLSSQRYPEQRTGATNPSANLPMIALLTSLTWFVCLMPGWLLIAWAHPRSSGIPVRLLQPGVILSSTDRQTTGLLLFIDQTGNLYLNSIPVTAEQLPHALEFELARRADSSVYIEGDSAVEYSVVIAAMDLVRGVNGKIVMMTPRMRAEAQARFK